MYHYFEFKNEEFLEHYHKRSNAETTFHMIKSKFGDAVRSKTEVAQVNEVLLKGAVSQHMRRDSGDIWVGD
jgi:transposase